MGQNFLVDANVVTAILDGAGVTPGARVLEIGPGLGVLSREILNRGGRLTAVEKDPALSAFLAGQWEGRRDVQLICGDALEVDLDPLLCPPPEHLIANLPYSCGTRILLRILEHPGAPASMRVTLQEEVAVRICAGAGTRARSLAGVWTQRMYKASILRRVSPGCFWPRPEVASAVVRLQRREDPPPDPETERVFRGVSRCAFTYRRKKLAGALRYLPRDLRKGDAVRRAACREAGVDPEARAEALSREQWLRLAEVWHRLPARASGGLGESPADAATTKGDDNRHGR